MQLTSLTCDGFRCIEHLEFAPAPGVNVIRGGNAQGKTTLLEALLFLVTARSHRSTMESELVRRGGDYFRIQGRFERHEHPLEMEVNWWRGAKRFKVNGVSQERVSDILGKVNVVFFSPGDVDLVRGPGSGRRRFLDMEISQLSSRYLHALQRYRDVLRQRNEILRRPEPDEAMLDVWDAQLAEHGEVIRSERNAFVDGLSGLAAEAYERVAGGERLSVRYAPDVGMDTPLADALQKSRTADLKRGVTSRGPHRDEIELIVAEAPARAYASQGQQRTAALALKLAEVTLIRERAGEYPILMLDDVLSELDEDRSRRLLEAAPEDVQCFLTTTGLDGARPGWDSSWTEFLIEAGNLARR